MSRSTGPGTTPDEAAATLADLARLSRHSRRVSLAVVTGPPLVAWGLAWAVGFPLLDLAPWRVALPVGSGLAVAAGLVSWGLRPRHLQTGREGPVRGGWLAVMLASPFLVLSMIGMPVPTILVVLGVLWGLAMLLYAVAAVDRAFAVVGALIVVLGGVVRHVVGQPLVVFGLVAGGAMVLLGVARTWRSRRAW